MSKSFKNHFSKAWWDTLMPLHNDEQRARSSFRNYFLGWPEGNKNAAYKLFIYVAAMRFFLPFFNIMRRPAELFLNCSAAALGWAKEQLAESDNASIRKLSYVAQGFQLLFKASFVMLRSLTAPFTHIALSRKALAQNVLNRRANYILNALSVILPLALALAIGIAAPPMGFFFLTCAVLEPIHLLNAGVSFNLRQYKKPVMIELQPMGEVSETELVDTPANQAEVRHDADIQPIDRQPAEDTHAYGSLHTVVSSDKTQKQKDEEQSVEQFSASL